MKKILFRSTKYPGISMILPERPNPPGGRGSYEFAVGTEYTLADSNIPEMRQQLASFPTHVRRHLTLLESDAPTPEASTATTAAIADPPKAAEPSATEGAIADPPRADSVAAESETPEEEEVPFELTEDDAELIQIEISKLYNKTIAEGQPLIEATAGNTDLHEQLRKAYLNAVIADEQLQKGLKETAQEWLELLEGNV